VFGVDAEHGFVSGARGRRIALGQSKIAEGKVGFGIARDKGVSPLKILIGRDKIVGLQGETAGVVGLEGPERRIMARNQDEQRAGRYRAELEAGLSVVRRRATAPKPLQSERRENQ